MQDEYTGVGTAYIRRIQGEQGLYVYEEYKGGNKDHIYKNTDEEGLHMQENTEAQGLQIQEEKEVRI